jgi:hypothetical protein
MRALWIYFLYLVLISCANSHAECHRLFPVPHEWAGSALHVSQTPSPYRTRTHALFILGGAPGTAEALRNYPAFWNTLSFGYQALIAKGVPKPNIRIVMGSGPQDRSVLTTETGANPQFGLDREAIVQSFQPFPKDFDCDGQPDVSGPATLAGIREALSGLIPAMKAHDQIVIYYIGHGIKPNWLLQQPFRATLWQGGLTVQEMEQAFRLVPRGVRTLFMADTCYGGHFLTLGESEDRCILTAAPRATESFFRRRTEYSFVGELFFSALLGGRPYSSAYPAMLPPGVPAGHVEPPFSEVADSDRNGAVDMMEAFNYIQRHYTQSAPQLSPSRACGRIAL